MSFVSTFGIADLTSASAMSSFGWAFSGMTGCVDFQYAFFNLFSLLLLN